MINVLGLYYHYLGDVAPPFARLFRGFIVLLFITASLLGLELGLSAFFEENTLHLML